VIVLVADHEIAGRWIAIVGKKSPYRSTGVCTRRHTDPRRARGVSGLKHRYGASVNAPVRCAAMKAKDLAFQQDLDPKENP
jgi:hypothetical protein